MKMMDLAEILSLNQDNNFKECAKIHSMTQCSAYTRKVSALLLVSALIAPSPSKLPVVAEIGWGWGWCWGPLMQQPMRQEELSLEGKQSILV